jgi:hypothetical protein
MSVHTGKFYVLSGLDEDGKVTYLAVAFNGQDLLDFIQEASMEALEKYMAFSIREYGSVLPEAPKETHPGSGATN